MRREETFKFRLCDEERQMIERLAARLERRPSDAVRFVIRQAARELEAAQHTIPHDAQAGGGVVSNVQ